jgi:hypothetical protein
VGQYGAGSNSLSLDCHLYCDAASSPVISAMPMVNIGDALQHSTMGSTRFRFGEILHRLRRFVNRLLLPHILKHRTWSVGWLTKYGDS